MSSKTSRKGATFIECFNGRVVVFIYAEDCKHPARLSSTLPKALAISEAVFYAATDARLRNPNAQRQTRRADLISEVLPFGRPRHDGPGAVTNAIGYAEHSSRSDDRL